MPINAENPTVLCWDSDSNDSAVEMIKHFQLGCCAKKLELHINVIPKIFGPNQDLSEHSTFQMNPKNLLFKVKFICHMHPKMQ